LPEELRPDGRGLLADEIPRPPPRFAKADLSSEKWSIEFLELFRGLMGS